MKTNSKTSFIKNKLLFINICLFLTSIFLGLIIFHIDIKSIFKKPVCNHCNVILISLDALGGNHLPCYGYDRNTAQNLCNFAKDNVFFTHAFSNAGWTLPSNFSIFTSLYPNHHNMTYFDKNKLDPGISTMTEFFKKANYETIYVGTLNDRSLPLERGLGRGFETTSDSLSSISLASWDKAISQLIENNNKKQSTFLSLYTYWGHYPYVVNDVSEGNNKRIFTNDFYQDIPLDYAGYSKFSKEFMDYILNQYENKIKEDNIVDKKNDQNIVDSLKGAKNITDAEKIYNNLVTDFYIKDINRSNFYFDKIKKSEGKISYTRSLYDEMIYYLDKKLVMILDLITKTELANNTIIIITADHGEEFMEHGSFTHPADHLYNSTTTVPLIMYIPGIKQRKVDDLVQSIDILPTILDLTGIKSSENHFDGTDMTDALLGHPQAKHNDYLISEGPNDSIRNNRWKLYVSYNDETNNTYELYDLYNDPLEKNNLAQKEPQIVKSLHVNLNKIIYKR
jgi:arylsulfatase A-like enzyme